MSPQIALPHLKIELTRRMPFAMRSHPVSRHLPPDRERDSFGRRLVKEFSASWKSAESELRAMHAKRKGLYLEFQNAKGIRAGFAPYEDMRSGDIRICNIRVVAKDGEPNELSEIITVRVALDKRNFFLDKIHSYLNDESVGGRPKNATFLEAIDSIRSAMTIHSFWVDEDDSFPTKELDWFEIWLRSGDVDLLKRFDKVIRVCKILRSSRVLSFPERTVCIVRANLSRLNHLIKLSDDLAEIRKARTPANLWLADSPRGQIEWCQDLLNRTDFDRESLVSVCILDTGVNNGHSLIGPLLSDPDRGTVVSEWGQHDHLGHGTMMAGLAGYGDLSPLLEASTRQSIGHVLESVKILPPPSVESTPAELWGDITMRAVAIPEIQAPSRKRVFCMAVTANETRGAGRPSSWSSAVDALCAGVEDGERRILIVSAGNAEPLTSAGNYPDQNFTDSIHDPAQAWNSVAVGSFTKLDQISDPAVSSYTPVAGFNELSPFSTTSLAWDNQWPLKPDIVMEGGNSAYLSRNDTPVPLLDDLSLISTYHRPFVRSFNNFGMTSASTALAANMAAKIQVAYPNYWPETIRALMIHSARWPAQIVKQTIGGTTVYTKDQARQVMRVCGYGVPSFRRAVECARNSLTLVAEAEMQPYIKSGSTIQMNHMHFYSLPWPGDVLRDLGNAAVELRVTLSYFVEPGPGELGWRDRYRYQSHALKFDMNGRSESEEEFLRRINSRVEGESGASSVQDSQYDGDNWVIGSRLREKGSVHSDVWKGTAVDLAMMNLIAVSPKVGWWRERKKMERFHSKTRYSLIISIHTPEESVDIYTPVSQMIAQQTRISINTNSLGGGRQRS